MWMSMCIIMMIVWWLHHWWCSVQCLWAEGRFVANICTTRVESTVSIVLVQLVASAIPASSTYMYMYSSYLPHNWSRSRDCPIPWQIAYTSSTKPPSHMATNYTRTIACTYSRYLSVPTNLLTQQIIVCDQHTLVYVQHVWYVGTVHKVNCFVCVGR